MWSLYYGYIREPPCSLKIHTAVFRSEVYYVYNLFSNGSPDKNMSRYEIGQNVNNFGNKMFVDAH